MGPKPRPNPSHGNRSSKGGGGEVEGGSGGGNRRRNHYSRGRGGAHRRAIQYNPALLFFPRGNNNSGKSGGATFSSSSQRQRLISEVSECGEDHCPVCLNRCRIFAVGLCNHHVCSECSTRMRVLCGQNECPICRQDMPKVVHTVERQKFEDVHNNVLNMDRRSRTCFETEEIEADFHRLLEHRCPVCDAEESRVFRQFKQLDQHVRREHEQFYCDLCVTHLKIYTHERRLYNRSDLALHRRKGDPDDTSHRGHPLCEFCDERFLDKEALFLHLRREHFFCHFCDADGLQQYYPDYPELRQHFASDHFLCLEGACQENQFTHAFRSEIDLKAHRAEAHSSSLSKAAAKQNRVVELDINYSRHQMNRRRGRDASPEAMGRDIADGGGGGGGSRNRANSVTRPPDLSNASFPTLNNDDFVLRSGRPAATGDSEMARRLAMSSGHNVRWSDGRRLPNNEEDFPSLPGSARSNVSNGHPRPTSAQTSRPSSQQQQSQPRPKKKTEDFPSLGRPTSSGSNLGPAAGPAPVYRNPTGYTPAWTAAGGGGAKPKAAGGNAGGAKKVAPAPILDDDDPPLPKPAVPSEPKMTRLKKQDRFERNEQPQPPQQQLVIANDFPDLAAKVEKPKEAKGKSKKKKNKGIGSLLSDLSPSEPVKAPPGVADSLAAAAALISIDDPKATTGTSTKTSDKNDGGTGEWSKVPAKEKSLPPPKPATKLAANGGVSTAIPGLAFEMNDQSKSRPTSSPSSSSSGRDNSRPTQHAATHSGEDFPSLGQSSKPMSANFRSFTPLATTSAVPSGRNQLGPGQTSSSSKAPPPGFGGAKKSKAPPPGFGGATASLATPSSNPRHIYRQPGSFNQRNVDLVTTITNLVGGKSLEFQEFKTISKQFRQGSLSCAEYYDKCLRVVGEDAFCAFLPELLALLPDIKKQNELKSIHSSRYPGLKLQGVSSCGVCRQVLQQSDLREHSESHSIDADFPRLGS